MDIEAFIDILDTHGIEYKTVGSSVCLKYCPACESDSYKVYLREVDDNLLGKCFKVSCAQGYSSFSYLLKMDLSYQEVLSLHGQDALTSFQMLNPVFFQEMMEGKIIKKEEKTNKIDNIDISKFMKISDWPDNPVSLYAKNRGACEEFYDRIYINPTDYAVVFLIKEDDKVLGYQQRFIKSSSNKDKTRNSEGFSKAGNLLLFPHETGDILICEGPFTALSAYHFGYYGICTFGASISEHQLKRISEISDFTGKDIGVSFDNDEAGSKGLKIIKNYFKKQNKNIFSIEFDNKYNDLNDVYMDGAKVFKKDTEEIIESWLPEIKIW